jgi:hypothetical protein
METYSDRQENKTFNASTRKWHKKKSSISQNVCLESQNDSKILRTLLKDLFDVILYFIFLLCFVWFAGSFFIVVFERFSSQYIAHFQDRN